MSGVEGIAPIAASAASAISTPATPPADPNPETSSAAFGDMISQGLAQIEARVDHADEMVRAFTLDDNVPVHQVTIALEEARLAVELALQVRTRVVEAYREVMNMQL